MKSVSSLLICALLSPALVHAGGPVREAGKVDPARVRENMQEQKVDVRKQQEIIRSVDSISRLLIETRLDMTGTTTNNLRALLSAQMKVTVMENGVAKTYDVSEIISGLARQAEAVGRTGTPQQKKEIASVASFVGLLARTSKSPQNVNFLQALEKEAILAPDILNSYKGTHREEHLREIGKTMEIAMKNPTMPGEKAYEEGLVQTAKDLAKAQNIDLADSKAREMAGKEAERKKGCLSRI